MALAWWRKWLRPSRLAPTRRPAPRRGYRPEITPLEDRLLPALGLVPGPTIDITQRAGTQNQPSITVDPTNPSRLFVVSNNDLNGLVAHRSTDGGSTWVSQVIAGGADGLPVAVGDAQASFDAFGNLFVTYTQAVAPGVSRINVLLSVNAGQSFTNIGGLAGLDTGATVDRPTVATGPGLTAGQGSVWVAWRSSTGGQIAARGATVTGLGIVAPFSPIQLVPNLNGEGVGNFATAAVGPSGQFLVGYQITFTGSDFGPGFIATSLDPDGLGINSGFLTATVATATNTGTNDDNPANQPADPTRRLNASPRLAWDRSNRATNGRVYLAFVTAGSAGGTNMTINLVTSTDSGLNWAFASPNAGQVSDTNVNSRFAPAIAVDPITGFVGITWYDARRDLGAGSPADSDGLPNTEVEYWGVVSTDGGRTFTPNARLSDGASSSIRASSINGLGEYTGVAFFDGVLYPAWADNSFNLLGNPQPSALDIAFARVRLNEIGAGQLGGFVAQVYLDILGRPADPGGLSFWTDLLARGAPRSQVVIGLLTTDEYHALVINEMYVTLLGRNVDPSGLAFGLAFLGNLPMFLGSRNLTEALRARILASDEYFARQGGTVDGFLTGLYRDVLGRGIEPGALQLYRGLLAQGTSRLTIAFGVIFSPEGLRRQIQGYYRRFLRRDADAFGIAFYSNMLLRGAADEEVISALVSSPEYFARFPTFGSF
jgi:hypothetical protein